MREIALHLIDLIDNSIKAKASLIEVNIFINRKLKTLELNVIDNGIGIQNNIISKVIDPYFTTDKSKRFGMGIPFLKQAAEITGGKFDILSNKDFGTKVVAEFKLDNINCLPLGNVGESVSTCLSNLNNADIIFKYQVDSNYYVFDTRELKKSLNSCEFIYEPKIILLAKNLINENIKEIGGANL